jgi:hypothetical protein
VPGTVPAGVRVRGQEDILRFQIAVDDALAVRRGQTVGDRRADF